MSPTKFHDNHHHPKTEPDEITGPRSGAVSVVGVGFGGGGCGGGLKINKESHFIRKPPSPSSSTSTVTPAAATKPRHPVIIYTHSPKIIHTNPKDFMALVQKLTGMSRSDEDAAAARTDHRGKPASDPTPEDNKNGNGNRNHNHSHNGGNVVDGKGLFVNNVIMSEDSGSSSVITTEETIGEQGQVNSSSCTFTAVPPPPPPPIFDPSPGINYSAYLSTIPVFATNPADNFLCGNQPFTNFDADSLFYASNMRSSFSSSSSSGFEGLTEFRDF